MTRAVAILVVVAACKDPTKYTVVTVDARPDVHGATTLKVTLSDESTSQTDNLDLGSNTFPTSFSVSAPGRSGDYTIAIDAVDGNDLLVGHGETAAMFGDADDSVMLAGADFVVNTDFAMNQFLSNDSLGNGFQLSATADGNWTATFRDDCNSPCNMFARRFDSTGLPVSSVLAAGTNNFPVSTTLTDFFSTPVVVASGENTLALWNFDDQPASTSGIACRPIDSTGSSIDFERDFSTDPSTDTVSASPLSNGNFAVSWTSFMTTDVIRAAILKPDCTVVAAPVTVSPTGASAFGSTVSVSGPNVLYSYLIGGALHVRTANSVNSFTTADGLLLSPATGEAIVSARFAPLGTGWAMAVRSDSATSTTPPGRIDLYKISSTGGLMGSPILVTDKAGSDFASTYSFGMAARADGVIMLVWHACAENGDGNGCGVFGQIVSPTGALVGTAFTVPTTTLLDQVSPSVTALSDSFVTAWSDSSGTAPDTSGQAVRARIIYVAADGTVN